jgi:hypothetical protein
MLEKMYPFYFVVLLTALGGIQLFALVQLGLYVRRAAKWRHIYKLPLLGAPGQQDMRPALMEGAKKVRTLPIMRVRGSLLLNPAVSFQKHRFGS